ncbi:MAG: glutamine amidotransferase [Gammaproteobacteria bacterium]
MNSSNSSALRILVVGESWIKHIIHLKGFDEFHSTEYEEGAGMFLGALGDAGYDITYIRAHEVSMRFPTTRADLDQFDVVILSDIGSNSFLLCDETWHRSERTVNRLSLIAEYVEGGGGLLMAGGYMSFSGIDGRARYQATPLAKVLPVTMLDRDDRVEAPEGVVATFPHPDHSALGGTPPEWPILLGYNQLQAKPGATTIAECGDDALLVTDNVGSGRAVAFASDVAPHWAPPEFMAWPHYAKLWSSIVAWAAGGRNN